MRPLHVCLNNQSDVHMMMSLFLPVFAEAQLGWGHTFAALFHGCKFYPVWLCSGGKHNNFLQVSLINRLIEAGLRMFFRISGWGK